MNHVANKRKDKLNAPFPYFGGKRAVADLVWSRLGNPDNYIEPFAGSLAVLLRRPVTGKVETVNDENHFLVNFWRAIQDVEGVVDHASHPVTEADLHARHAWLMDGESSAEFKRRVTEDPAFYDVKFAGWWVWGQCCWIGSGWCIEPSTQVTDLAGTNGSTGRGIAASAGHNKRPMLCSEFDQPGTGVHRGGLPQLGDAFDTGRGVNGNKHAGTCKRRREWLTDWLGRLADRLRLVRVCYGDWSRVCDSRTTMTRLGLTGVFLDPPYAHDLARVQTLVRGESAERGGKANNRDTRLYAGDREQDIDRLVADVNRWCQRWGRDSSVRIALCGYAGEHDNLVDDHGWTVQAWKAQGGYANRNADNTNKTRERIWYSPACINPEDMLF